MVFMGTDAAHAQTGGPPEFVSPPVVPLAVTVDPEALRADPSQAPPVTVEEGGPPEPLPPGVPSPIVDPVIQTEDSPLGASDRAGLGTSRKRRKPRR